MSLFDLNPKSTGTVVANQNWDPNGGLLDVAISPNYYSDPNGEDIFNLCWIVRNVAAAIIAADPAAVFTAPATPYPFPVSDAVLFPLLTANFAQQAHYVGSCGMGNNKTVHCVKKNFKLRGTCNVKVCDASSMPLEIDDNGVIFPVQNDGNTSRGVNVLSSVLIEKMRLTKK